MQTTDITKKIVVLLFFLGAIQSASAQSFVEPLKNCGNLWFPKNHECIIEDVNGKILKGKILTGVGVGSAPKWIKFQDESGYEVKIDAEMIKTMKVKASDLIKFSTSVENLGSLQEAGTTDWSDIIDKEYLYYEQALTPNKKNKSRLYQLLNPGFDSKIKVYDDPYGNSGGFNVGGLGVTGGQEKSYLIAIESEKTMKLKKGDYKKQFHLLFSGCDAMLHNFNSKKVKLSDFPLHLFYYDQHCNVLEN